LGFRQTFGGKIFETLERLVQILALSVELLIALRQTIGVLEKRCSSDGAKVKLAPVARVDSRKLFPLSVFGFRLESGLNQWNIQHLVAHKEAR